MSEQSEGKKTKMVATGGCSFGVLWIAGWLFSIGFLRLMFWKGVLAIVLWPYFLGDHFALLSP